ncbi:MAG: sugar ABC transporter substrate-binding protein [Tenericutes bacterium]|nr:sugar ABC transporter substrate-binding protein [Mycoplasmatota bacterium]
MKKTLTCIMILLVIFLGACNGEGNSATGEATNEDGTVSIEFYGWGSAEEAIVFQTLVDEFMVQNPDIIVSYTSSSPDTYMRVLQNRVNNLPDVFYLPDTEFMLWADSGRLLSLSDYAEEETLDSIWPEAINRYMYDRDEQVLGEGELYALPKDLGPFTLVYNKTLFDKINTELGLGLDYPSQDTPMTWDSFVSLLETIKYTKSGQQIFGITHYELLSAIYSNNADFFAADIKTEGISDINFSDALQFIADLYLENYVMPSPDEQISMNGYQRFSTGGAVFSFMGPWDSVGFWENLSFEYEVIPVPYGPADGAESTTWVGSMGFAISAETKKAEAAYKLAKFLSVSETSQRMSYELGQSIPNVIDMAKNDYVNGVGLEGENQYLPYNREIFVSIVEGTDLVAGKARPQYYTYDSIWYDDLQAELEDVYLGNETAAEFCARYAETLQAALDESYSYIE